MRRITQTLRHSSKLRHMGAAMLLLLLGVVLTWPDTNRKRERQISSHQLSVPGAVQTSYPPPTFIPDPVATARAQPPTSVPEPPYIPPPTVTLPPPPEAQVFPPTKSDLAPNIAWSAQSDNSLTIWVGRYSDSPTPRLEGQRPIARWNNIRLELSSMKVSPDHRRLALLFFEPCVPSPRPPTEPPPPPGTPQIGIPNTGDCGGDWPQHIYTVDLTTSKVQSIPDYYRHYSLYAQNSYPYFKKILGWFDNSRFGVELKSNEMVVALKDGSSFLPRPWPGLTEYGSIFELSMLPDRKTLFAWVNDGFYLRDAHSGVAQRVGNRLKITNHVDPENSQLVAYTRLVPAPNGRRIVHQEPEAGRDWDDGTSYELWGQELATDQRYRLTESGVWDFEPAWSHDSAHIAFAFGQSVSANKDDWSADFATWYYTDIYIADIGTRSSHKLTNFQNAHNRDIQWTPGGNLVLSSTASSRMGGFDLVAVSTVDGKAVTLVSAAPGQRLVRPLLFDVDLPGMPVTGLGDGR